MEAGRSDTGLPGGEDVDIHDPPYLGHIGDGQVMGQVHGLVIPDEDRVLSQIAGQEHLLDKLAHSDGFVAGQWCATKEQKDFYKHELAVVL